MGCRKLLNAEDIRQNICIGSRADMGYCRLNCVRRKLRSGSLG